MTYYRVTTRAGNGLGYESLYGDEPRYYLTREAAQARADALNQPCEDPSLEGTYFVEERRDGQDKDDEYFADMVA